MCELPSESVEYTSSGGASVDLSGVRMDLQPGALGEQDADIKVFRAPFDEWEPRFDDIGMDALYFLSPYWYTVTGTGVELSIGPPDGWQDGDTGVLYMLGDYAGDQSYLSYYLECEGEEVPVGDLVPCGSVEMSGGRVVTDPVLRFGWVGLKKD